MKLLVFGLALLCCVSNVVSGEELKDLGSEVNGLANIENGILELISEIWERITIIIRRILHSDVVHKILEYLGKFLDTIRDELHKIVVKWTPKVVDQFKKLPSVVLKGHFWRAVGRIFDQINRNFYKVPELIFWEILQTLDRNKPIIEETFYLAQRLTHIYIENLKKAIHDLIWGYSGESNDEGVANLTLQRFLHICRMIPQIFDDDFWKVVRSHWWDIFNVLRGGLKLAEDFTLHLTDDSIALQRFLHICRMIPQIFDDEFWKVVRSHWWDIFNVLRGGLKLAEDFTLHLTEDSIHGILDMVSHVLDEESLLSELKTSDEVELPTNGFKEIWDKIVKEVKSYTGAFKEDLKRLVVKYKPRILEELLKFKKVVIEEGKGLVIEMLGDAIKIIIKGGIGYEE